MFFAINKAISSHVSVTGKFDTEYVLSTLKRAAKSLKKAFFGSFSFMTLQKFQF